MPGWDIQGMERKGFEPRRPCELTGHFSFGWTTPSFLLVPNMVTLYNIFYANYFPKSLKRILGNTC